MKNFLFIALYLLVITTAFAQVDTAWVKRYNGPGNSTDEAYAITIDDQGNVYVTGASYGSGTQYDYATIKYNSSGETLWVRRYNVPGMGWDIAQDIAVDNLGNVFVTGYSWGSTDYKYDYVTIKYNSAGVEQWVNRYNGIGNDWDIASDLEIDNQGNIYVTGWSDSIESASISDNGYVTIKYNTEGEVLWIRRYDGPISEDAAYALTVDQAGNVYVTGESQGPYSPWYDYDYATVKYDSIGTIQWAKRYNGPGNRQDEAYAIAVDEAGNVYVTGGSRPDSINVEGYDYLTIKYNSDGVEQWISRYDGPRGDMDVANALILDNQGNVFVTGLSSGTGTMWDIVTIKYNSEGDTVWVRRYNGPDDGPDVANCIALDNYGNVYVSGYSCCDSTYNDYVLIKYNSNGEELWVERYAGPGRFDDEIRSMALDNTGNIYVTGLNHGTSSDDDFLTIKYVQTGGLEESKRFNVSHLMPEIYPNPAKSVLRVRIPFIKEPQNLKIFDVSGKLIKELIITKPEVNLSLKGVNPGIYFLKLGAEKIIQKLIITK
jgi:uncharacterized delta-60 repeat protein